jgi:hypothetical protein
MNQTHRLEALSILLTVCVSQGEFVEIEELLKSEPRKYLNKLVSLKSQSSFLEAVHKSNLADFFHDLTGFSVASARKIGLDTDGRLFGSKIDFENSILDVPNIEIRDSKKVKLFNCVILGNLYVGGHERTQDVEIDNCLVLGTLCICGNDANPDLKVNIWNSNCTVLKINSSRLNEISIGASNIHDCHFVNTSCDWLRMTSNRMQFFRLEGFEVTNCDFFHDQVNLSKSFPAEPVRSTREAEDIDWKDRSAVLLDFSLGANLYSQSTFETLSFLRSRTFIAGDQRSLSDLRYRTALLSQNRASKAFVRLTRAFESPGRFAVYAAAILLSAALVYVTPFCGFVRNTALLAPGGGYQIHSDVCWGLPFLQALYFSCITFTTIGYGDLVPIGIARAFAASEGLLGVVIGSSFVVALVKRYMEK